MAEYGGLREATSTDYCPEFFKVFLPYTSSHQMSIPESFIKNFKRVIPKKAILFDHSKKLWHVKLKQTSGRLFFKNGWQDFATDHSLEFGDFLVFKYHRNSRFEVKIFSKSGCEKEVAVNETISSNQNSQPNKTCRRQAHIGKQKPLEIGFQKNEEASCSFKVGWCKLQRNVRTIPEERKIPEGSHFVPPKNPYFVLDVSKHSKYALPLPKSVICPFNIRVMSDVVIHDQNGNMWPVKINVKSSGRVYIGGGWCAFINENNVKVRDQCVIEFVLGEESICNELHVQILRGAARVKKPYQRWIGHMKA